MVLLRNILILGLLLSSARSVASAEAVLVEDNGRSVPAAGTTSYEINSSGHGFRQHKRVGFGFGLIGAYGLAGPQLELNFIPEVGITTGFGLGPGYQAFNLQVKRILAGDSLMPYIAGGVARWYSVGPKKSRRSTQPGFLADRFLNGSEKRTGEFAEIIIYPSVGIQYMQLDGSWAGFSVYAEVLLMVDVDDLVTAGNGGLGVMYYF